MYAVRMTTSANNNCINLSLKPRIIEFALLSLSVLMFVALSSCAPSTVVDSEQRASANSNETISSIRQIPPFSGSLTAIVNGGEPFFAASDFERGQFEEYSDLDSLGRCGAAFALIGKETMPSGERGSIGMIKPSGWQIDKYDFVDGGYLFNRCHLIAFSLAGENDNERNLITGTRTMNVKGMLPYEERTASYVDTTGNHVLYRVTPVFEGDNLVATGVLMEAQSVEDGGSGIRFCVWCYNVEPGVSIDYATGDNHVDASSANASEAWEPSEESSSSIERDEHGIMLYVLNTNTKRFHFPECPSVLDIKDSNKKEYEGSRSEIIDMGYKPCGTCRP